ncbi:MAG: hypothetical protein K9L59_08250 [Desulfobacterales bacterium]|nr:hypothetical protein [Desulfobacterales bacterium]MCF8079294.1 hypothetical protein [Desulfobacterales bacterium]
MGFLTGINLFGAALGFMIGVFGFIIVRYWIRPVSRYGRLKRRAADAVGGHLSLLEENPAGSQAKQRFKESRQRLRRTASELTDAFHQELPHWYRIRLRARGENPPEAAGLLMKLSNTRDPVPGRRQGEQIRELLFLQGKRK